MRKPPLVGVLAACLLTSACAIGPLGPLPQGVGFTGVGAESVRPKDLPAVTNPLFGGTVADADAVPNYRAGLDGQRVSLPRTSVVSGATTPAAQAEIAIRNADSIPGGGRAVTIGGQELRLGGVTVNGTEYAVLRAPKGFLKSRTVRVTPETFVAEVPVLTGCATEGAAYGLGADRARPTGLAVKLLCF